MSIKIQNRKVIEKFSETLHEPLGVNSLLIGPSGSRLVKSKVLVGKSLFMVPVKANLIHFRRFIELSRHAR